MAYDNTSLTGDEICDYHYDIENNFMNPPSPTGYFIYKVIGGAFDRLNDLVTQFRNDYSILDCNVGNVEIVKSFPEEADTNHTYYVHQYNTSTDACFTKYSYVDGEWVSETVTGDVLNSLDVFWGRSYNLPRPLLYEGQKREYLFVDNGTTASHNDNWNTWSTYTVSRTRSVESTLIEPVDRTTAGYQIKYINNMSSPRIIEFDCCQVGGATNRIIFQLRGNNQSVIRQIALSSYRNLSVGEWYHWKVDLVNGKFTNETTNQTLTFSTEGIISFFFVIQANAQHNLKYKNFRIYTGEEKERPLTDEEYLIYLYLKNHQLLTMKDLLVAFGNAFGSAETGTTLLNSIHTVDHKTYDNPQFSNDSLMAYDDEDMDITTDKLVDKTGVNLINNRFAQGTLSIQIPDEGWDEEFLSLLESFISIKGNILISQGG